MSPTKRIIPLKDVGEDWTVEFLDGPRTVPEENRRFLEPRQRKIAMTYVDWLRRVVDAYNEARIFGRAIDNLIAPHLGW